MTAKLLMEQHLEFLSFTRGGTGSSESVHVKMQHCWKSCFEAHLANSRKNKDVRKSILSYDVASGSEIMPCNKIDKPLVVYRFSGNVMTSITMLST